MDRYACGEDQAFQVLATLLTPRLLTYLRRSLRDAALAEDLAQTTLMRIHLARARFVLGSPVLPWAIAIARRLMIDELRRVPARPVGLELVGAQPSPDDALAARQLVTSLERALAELPPSQQIAFRLLRLEGHSPSDAAALLGTTAMAVKLRTHRAQGALRATCARHGFAV